MSHEVSRSHYASLDDDREVNGAWHLPRASNGARMPQWLCGTARATLITVSLTLWYRSVTTRRSWAAFAMAVLFRAPTVSAQPADCARVAPLSVTPYPVLFRGWRGSSLVLPDSSQIHVGGLGNGLRRIHWASAEADIAAQHAVGLLQAGAVARVLGVVLLAPIAVREFNRHSWSDPGSVTLASAWIASVVLEEIFDHSASRYVDRAVKAHNAACAPQRTR